MLYLFWHFKTPSQIFLTVRQVNLYLCDYDSSLLHAPHHHTLQLSFSGKPFLPSPPLSELPLRLLEPCLQVSITFHPSAASIYKCLTEAAVSSEGREGWEDWQRDREKKKINGITVIRERIRDRCVYQNGRMKIERQRLWVSAVKADGSALSGRLPGGEDK